MHLMRRQTTDALSRSARCLLLLALCAGRAGAAESVPLARNQEEARSLIAQALAKRTAFVSDLTRGSKGEVFVGQADGALPPGRYRLHAQVAIAPLGNIITAPVRIILQTGTRRKSFSTVFLPADDQFVDLTMDFRLGEASETEVGVTWDVPNSKLDPKLADKRSVAIFRGSKKKGGTVPDSDALLGDDPDGDTFEKELESSDTVPLDEAKATHYRLMVAGVLLERLGPVEITELSVSKIIYKPGEKGSVSVELANRGAKAVSGRLKLELRAGFDPARPLIETDVAIPAGKILKRDFSDLLSTEGLCFGAEVRAALLVPGASPEVARDCFGVTDNFWELGHHTFTGSTVEFHDLGRARRHAREWRDGGTTVVEALFWGPCDMLDYTPDTEYFFGGQGGYAGTITGTKNLIQACHEQGLSVVFYANLYGGSGPPGFEVERQHPFWFGGSGFSNLILDNWDLLGANADMQDRQIRAPGITWCHNCGNFSGIQRLIELHAQEVVATIKMFGWDGIRYDSAYCRGWSAKGWRHVRSVVGQEFPGFRFGYNSSAPNGANALALDDMVSGGGSIMGEGLRLERQLDLVKWAEQVMDWRDLAWPYGGAVQPLYHPPGTDLDKIMQACVWLACGAQYGGHDGPETAFGNSASYAIRYSEIFYNQKLKRLARPKEVVSFGRDPGFLFWERMVHTVTLADRQHRLVLNLLNVPSKYRLNAGGHDAPPPQYDSIGKAPVTNLPVTVNLPEGAKIRSVYNVCRLNEEWHQPLESDTVNGKVRFTVPRVRFWNTIVIDYEADRPVEAAVTEKERTDTYVRDWQVIGPFPGDEKLTGYDQIAPLSTAVDRSASYPGADGKTVKWKRSTNAGEPALGPHGVDFQDLFGTGGITEFSYRNAYAWTVVESDRERWVTFCLRADDTAAIWLNGQQAFAKIYGEFHGDVKTDPVTLKKGRNELLVKINNKWLFWRLALRIANLEGNPITEGIKVSAAGH